MTTAENDPSKKEIHDAIFNSKIPHTIENIVDISPENILRAAKEGGDESSGRIVEQKHVQNDVPELVEKAEKAIRKAADVMRTKHEFESSWEIAVHIMSLVDLGDKKDIPIIEEWAGKLKDPGMRNHDGGWFSGFDQESRTSNVYDTSFAIVALLKAWYVFSWTKIPGTDDERLKEFLKKRSHIDWVCTAGFVKSEDGKTINISNEDKTLSLTLNNEESEVILKIDNIETDKFIAKKENGELNIYKAGEDSDLEIIKKGIDFIQEMNNSTYKGWPAKKSEEMDVGATSWAIIALAKVPYSNRSIMLRGIEWLKFNQHQDGGWGQHYYDITNGRPSLIAKTSDAVAALLENGESPNKSPEIKDAVQWMIRRQSIQKDEKIKEWVWSWGKNENIVAHNVENTSCAIITLLKCAKDMDLDSSSAKLIMKLVKLSIKWLLQRQNTDGTWEDDDNWGSSITPRVVSCLNCFCEYQKIGK